MMAQNGLLAWLGRAQRGSGGELDAGWDVEAGQGYGTEPVSSAALCWPTSVTGPMSCPRVPITPTPAMDQVLTEARAAGRHPTVTAVERALDISHATFYRNLITNHFQRQQAADNTADPHQARQQHQDTNRRHSTALQRLRQENTELRRLV